jgi:hypothetical protein
MFDETVIANLLANRSSGARRALLHRAIVAGDVLRLKPGLYCLAPRLRRSEPHPYVVAGMLHAPSQVSLETALSFHGLIPEAVYQVASVTGQRSRTFSTPLGQFVFTRVPCDALRAGVRVHQVAPNAWAFVSDPVRAIADLVYLRREVRWDRAGLGFLTESLRIEPEDLRAMSLDGFDEVQATIRNKRTVGYLDGLRRELMR